MWLNAVPPAEPVSNAQNDPTKYLRAVPAAHGLQCRAQPAVGARRQPAVQRAAKAVRSTGNAAPTVRVIR